MPRSPRNPPQQQRAIETRTVLLLAAARVFSRMPYAEAKLKDISAESGISEGSLYFHFGNKSAIAAAVIESQQERMVSALTRVLGSSEDGLSRMLRANEALAELIATDVVVQGGIRLEDQQSVELQDLVRDPYFEWIRVARDLVEQGIEDGSVRSDIDPDDAAQFLNALFIGVQVLSGLDSAWASMPRRMKRLEPHILRVIGRSSEDT